MEERRKSCRIRILLGRDQALVRVGKVDVEVQLQNESSTGFGILCPPGPQFQVGQIIQLRTAAGWFGAKAVRVEKVPAGTLLGLERGHEIPSLDRAPRHKLPWIGVVSAVGLGILAVPAVTIFMGYWQPHRPAVVRPRTSVVVDRPLLPLPIPGRAP